MGFFGVDWSTFSSLLFSVVGMPVSAANGSPPQSLFRVLNYADDFAGVEKHLARPQLSFKILGELLSDLRRKLALPALSWSTLGLSSTPTPCACMSRTIRYLS